MSEEKKSMTGIRFNILDAAIVLLALFCAIGIWQYDNLQRLFVKEQSADYAVSFKVAYKEGLVEELTDGTTVYVMRGESRYQLGILTGDVAVEIKAPTDEDANVRSIVGSIGCRLTPAGERYHLFSDFSLAPGDNITVLTDHNTFTLQVVEIAPIP